MCYLLGGSFLSQRLATEVHSLSQDGQTQMFLLSGLISDNMACYLKKKKATKT